MKILVSDLDGTIYRNKTVSAIDLKMINDFASRNMFVIATGRNENIPARTAAWRSRRNSCR